MSFLRHFNQKDYEKALAEFEHTNQATRKIILQDLKKAWDLGNEKGREFGHELALAAIRSKVKGGWSDDLLHASLLSGDERGALLALTAGANPNAISPSSGNSFIEQLTCAESEFFCSQSTIRIVEKMLSQGGSLMYIHPGAVSDIDVLRFLISKLPHPSDVEAWKAKSALRLDNGAIITYLSRYRENSEKKIDILIDSGFELDPGGALYAALETGMYNNARYLLKKMDTSALADYRDEDGNTIWHAVFRVWGERMYAVANMGWDVSEVIWPPSDIIEHLCAIDPHCENRVGVSPAEFAHLFCGDWGPIDEITSLIESKKISEDTLDVSSRPPGRTRRI